VRVHAAGALLQADLPDGAGRVGVGDAVHLHWDAQAVHALEARA